MDLHHVLPDAATRRASSLVLAGAALGAAAWALQAPRPMAAPAACPTTAAGPAAPLDVTPVAEPPMVGALRLAALAGDADAVAALTDMLLDRYEQAQDSAALVEALHWLQQGWDGPDFRAFRQLARVSDGACNQTPLLRLHWLCQQGE